MAYDPTQGEIFVTEYEGPDSAYTSLDVISDSSGRQVGSVAVGTVWDLVFDSSNDELFAINTTTEVLDVISGANDSLTATTALSSFILNPHDEPPWGPDVFDSGQSEVFAAIQKSILVISTASDAVVATINGTDGLYQSADNALSLTYDAAQGQVFAAYYNTTIVNGIQSIVDVISDTSNKVVASLVLAGDVGLGAYDQALAEVFLPQINSVYAPYSQDLYVISTSSDSLVSSPEVGDNAEVANELALDPANGQLLETGLNPGYAVIDASSGVVSARVAEGSGGSILFDAGRSEFLLSNMSGTGLIVQSTDLLDAANVSASHDPVDANNSVTFSTVVRSVAQNLTLGYNYTLPSGQNCSPSAGPSLNCTPPLAGAGFSVSVAVSDPFGQTVSANSSEELVSAPLIADLSESNSTPLLGQTVAFVVNASGGAGPPYTFSFAGLPPGCLSENRSAIGCLPTQANYYNISATVTDANRGSATSNVTMHVVFDFNVIVPSTVSAGSPFTISVNTNETFSGGTAVAPMGGIGALTYNYTGLPPGCASADVATLSCTTDQVGNYSITVSVHDQADDHNSHSVTVHVVPANVPASTSSYVWYLIAGGVVALCAVGVLLARGRRRRERRGTASTGSPQSDSTRPPA